MVEKEIKFSKEQILSSKQFTVIEKDILKALLEDKQYSLKEVKKIIDDFKKKEVK
ncbi:hypothetical protein phiCT453A_40 (endogenous virus) [Clostridium phage phiCT453A]|uniref:hypothetical protein n=1 Tax=Clostridium phage phiCT453A TaxID=1567012 RepID=UPI000572A8E6|nr:hypothetical protein [Clostridium tetani]YP_009216684.1 hypothetical protein phiCT453A_40 [Clostridium phage phiCT453A]AJA42530.1 hypothetical protein phiCT453A_40 [Clostridium phage phiCT453A]